LDYSTGKRSILELYVRTLKIQGVLNKKMDIYCYDFEKHMMITFAIVATVLIIGLFSQVVKGQTPEEAPNKTAVQEGARYIVTLETLVDYCFEHASDSANPVQDLVDKGLISPQFTGETCGSAKLKYENIMNSLRDALTN
jgi:hypothetical protein